MPGTLLILYRLLEQKTFFWCSMLPAVSAPRPWNGYYKIGRQTLYGTLRFRLFLHDRLGRSWEFRGAMYRMIVFAGCTQDELDVCRGMLIVTRSVL